MRKIFHGLGLIIFMSSTLVLAACQKGNTYIQGYVDARYTYISSNVTGRLETISVHRGEAVQAGQILFTLDPEPQYSELLQAKEQVKQARDQLKSAKASLKLAKLTLARQTDLEKTDATAIQAADEARAQYEQALATWQQGIASLRSSRAALTKAAWSFSEKKIYSNKTGTIFDTYYTAGELIPSGQPVLSILNPENIYVVFYVREPMLHRIQLNQSIGILDSENGKKILAKISYISASAEYTPPVIYSNETNEKLVYRVEAQLLSPTNILHPGEPVQVEW